MLLKHGYSSLRHVIQVIFVKTPAYHHVLASPGSPSPKGGVHREWLPLSGNKETSSHRNVFPQKGAPGMSGSRGSQQGLEGEGHGAGGVKKERCPGPRVDAQSG